MAPTVATMLLTERLKEVLTRSRKKFGPEVAAAIDALLSPVGLHLAGILMLWAGSHLFGVGEVVRRLPARRRRLRRRLLDRRCREGSLKTYEIAH